MNLPPDLTRKCLEMADKPVPVALSLPPNTNEEEFLFTVIEYAQAQGWRVAHFRPAKTAKGWRTAVQADGKGFPDLVLVRERVLFAELKTEEGQMTPAQKDWLSALMTANAGYFLWRPSDWNDIRRILK